VSSINILRRRGRDLQITGKSAERSFRMRRQPAAFSDFEMRDAFDRVLVVVYTWRGTSIRLISAWKASRREQRDYEG
jgi:uncharacterized DUF497 family protein